MTPRDPAGRTRQTRPAPCGTRRGRQEVGRVTAYVGDTMPAGGRAPGDGDVPAIEATALVKRFGTTTAVAGVDLRIPQGGVHGFLGPNGAGKTTPIRMLATLLPAACRHGH